MCDLITMPGLSKMKWIGKLKPVYVEPYNKVIRFTVLGTNEEVKLCEGQFEYLKDIFPLDVFSQRITDRTLLFKIASMLDKRETRKELIDYLEYFRLRWLNNIHLTSNEFNHIAKIIIKFMFNKKDHSALRSYYFNLRREKKYNLILGIFSAVLFNKSIVLDY